MIVETTDRDAFAAFVAPLQQRPESNVSNIGVDPVGIVKELEEFETRLFVDDNAGQIRGATGFDFDVPTQRGYLYGPWSLDDGWAERTDRLLAHVLDIAPPKTRDVEIAFDKRNRRVAGFGARHGFELVRDHFTMLFEPDERTIPFDPDIREMHDTDREALIALHERSFERMWPSGEQLLDHLTKGPDRKVFVLYEGDELVGYHYALVDRDTGEAFIHNIGVATSHQGRGLATRLLRHGLAWMFTFPEVKRIELSVREENAPAIRVYEKAGFRKTQAVRQMRKQLHP